MKIFLTALMMLLVMSHPAAAQLGGPGWSPGMAVAHRATLVGHLA